MSTAAAVAIAGCSLATCAGGVRWLRVAQREHYLPGSVSRFAARWWRCSGVNLALVAAGTAGAVTAAIWPLAALVTAAVTVVGPIGLSLRGRTSKLAWTRRLRTLAGAAAVIGAGAVGLAAALRAGDALAAVSAGAALLAPLIVDAACLLTVPLEERLGRRHVQSARAVLGRVSPVVVAVTGSYGKTTTKLYIAHLVGSTKAVLASPASYNNRAGLARTVNDHLVCGTEVLVAEMGTYGPGEIADLCSWLTPQVGVITAIGPVHLERFGTEDRIVAAKSEILQRASVAVLNVDDPRLAALADVKAARGMRVLRCSARDRGADVCVVQDPRSTTVLVGGSLLAEAGELDARPTNLACAVAVALELGVPGDSVARLLPTLPGAPSRLEVGRSPSGFVVIDDTYNSNPAGAKAALEALARCSDGASRKVVVTPGMVELGPRQAQENRAFAAAAGSVATDLVVVGRTNRRALVEGARAARPGPRLVTVSTREQAVDWVRTTLREGDVVLYENDLPDHFC